MIKIRCRRNSLRAGDNKKLRMSSEGTLTGQSIRDEAEEGKKRNDQE